MFKQLFTTTIFLLSAFNIYASGNMDMDMSNGKKEKMNMSERQKLDENTKKQVLKVLESNENLHAAFFKYDGKKAESSAKALKASIESIENVQIAKLLKFSKEKLDEIKAERDRKKNNQTYHLVSMALIHVINKYDVGDKYNAYSCPMVKKKWVQNSKKLTNVSNPYMASMPMCGSQDSKY